MSHFPGLSTKAMRSVSSPTRMVSTQKGFGGGGVISRRRKRSPMRTAMSGRSEPLTGIDAGERAPPKAAAAENPQLRRLAPAPIFVVRRVLWP
jgi:hypothetical protein